MSCIILDSISSISLANNVELAPSNINDKYGILDVKATLNNSMLCDVEMQVSKDDWMTSRALFYWSKLYSEQLKNELEDTDMENENIKEAKEKFDKLQDDYEQRELAM